MHHSILALYARLWARGPSAADGRGHKGPWIGGTRGKERRGALGLAGLQGRVVPAGVPRVLADSAGRGAMQEPTTERVEQHGRDGCDHRDHRPHGMYQACHSERHPDAVKAKARARFCFVFRYELRPIS